MTKIALFGAGGKMGMRLGANLKNTHFTVAPVEVSDAGKTRLRDELGWQAAPVDHALQGAEIVVLAVPDTAIGKVAHSIVDRLAPGAGQGHRTVPHTADLRVEAWGPTREACLAEAVHGLVDSFAVVSAARPRHTAERRFVASSDEDLLVAVIEEVIYRLDADGEIPVTAAVRSAPDGGVILTLPLADVHEAEIAGAAPKAASLHDLRCAPDAAGRWSCGITIDV